MGNRAEGEREGGGGGEIGRERARKCIADVVIQVHA